MIPWYLIARAIRLTAFLVTNQVTWCEFRRAVSRPTKLVFFLKRGGVCFCDRDLERSFFGY